MPAKKKQSTTSSTKNQKSKDVSLAEFPSVPVHLEEQKITDDFRRNTSELRSNLETPKNQIKRRPDGFDYVDEAYMRRQLTKHFPNWSWIPSPDNPVQFLGSEWIIVAGSLVVDDLGEKRTFFSPGGTRIQFKKGQPHTADNVIDVDKQLGAANANAFKRAVNRLCNVADDVYRKQDLDLTELQLDQLRTLITDSTDLPSEMISRVKVLVQTGKINKNNFDLQYEQLKNEITNINEKE